MDVNDISVGISNVGKVIGLRNSFDKRNNEWQGDNSIKHK